MLKQDPDLKWCWSCRTVKNRREFHYNKSKKDGRSDSCKSCGCQASKEKSLRRSSLTKEMAKNRQLKKDYGITLKEFDHILSGQGGLCKICKTDISTKGSAQTDHDHKTGKVRGLLCSNCNRGLGMFKDNVTLLTSAVGYLTNEGM